MTKEVKTTVVEAGCLEVWDEDSQEFVVSYPSAYYIVNGLGQYIFYHCRKRSDAQKACDDTFGVGKYTVRQAKQSSGGSKEYSAVGVPTRKCFSPRLKGLK